MSATLVRLLLDHPEHASSATELALLLAIAHAVGDDKGCEEQRRRK